MYIASLMHNFYDISLYSVVCAALQPRGTPCVLTLQTHTGLPPLCRHSGLHSCSITAFLWHTLDTVGHQIPEHNLSSVLLYPELIVTHISTT